MFNEVNHHTSTENISQTSVEGNPQTLVEIKKACIIFNTMMIFPHDATLALILYVCI